MSPISIMFLGAGAGLWLFGGQIGGVAAIGTIVAVAAIELNRARPTAYALPNAVYHTVPYTGG